MSTADELLAARLADIPFVNAGTIGVFRTQVGALCEVEVSGSYVLVPSMSATPPIPGESVRLLQFNDVTLLAGPTVPRAPFGRVVSVGPFEAVVEYPPGSSVTKSMLIPTGLSLAVNDTVSIDWLAGGVIGWKYTSAPAYVVPPAPTAVDPGTKTETFTAVQAGSYGTAYGWNTPDVWASNSYTGAWFYQNKMADNIPDAAVINAAKIYLPIRKNSGGDPIFGVHTSSVKPSGNVTFVSTAALTTRSGWVDIPTSYIDYLKANPGGLGMNSGGFSIWNGVDGPNRDAMSGAVQVTYTI